MLPLAVYFEVDTVKGWLLRGSYGTLFGLLFSCGLGFPLPEDVPLIAAGMLIYHHHMHLAIAAPLAWLGIIGGDCVLYTLGYRYGEEISKVPFIGKHVTPSRIQRAELLFQKYGVWMVAVGRLFMGIRGAMVVAAGTSRLKFHKFIIADGLAAIVSGGMFMFVGYWGGEYGPEMVHRIRQFKYSMWIGAALLAVMLFCWFFWRDRNHSADSASPK
ncbi:MAG: DedA family protein [Tepidisphaeraceae bacterium]|jgi:membrane protein DedA with SNARE-associated domain